MTGKRAAGAGAGLNSPTGSPPSMSPNRQDQDGFLPIANVSRIMKKSLPANAKISKEAKETVQECVSEFISFITGEASDKCQREKRKTINGDDLLWAMTTLGFENYVGPLKVYLNRYRETEGEKINSMARQQEDNSGSGNVNVGGFGGLNEMSSMTGGPLGAGGINRADIQSFYGQSLIAGAGGMALNSIHDSGDANGGRAMAAQIHNGVGW